MAMHYFLNFGGPGSWTAFDEDSANHLNKLCQYYYSQPNRYIQFNINGITATICTYSIHRALILHVPDGASDATLQAFDNAKIAAATIMSQDYNILSNNCVTAVASALHAIDPRITPANVILPWTLDLNLKNYGQYYPENSVAGSFIAQYSTISKRELFSFLRTRHWEKNIIQSEQDIIKHAYGKTGGSGERTKSTLLQLGWVIEDKHRILRPTKKAPEEFKLGLEAFNLDYENMLNLKRLYRSQASLLSINAKFIFKDNPDYETALSRLHFQAAKNPKSVSAKVLKILEHNQLSPKNTIKPF